LVFFNAFWGLHGMSLLLPPDPFKQIVMILVGISTAGLGLGIVLKIKQLGRKIIRDWRTQCIFFLFLSILLIVLAQSLFNIQYFVVKGDYIAFGHFTFIAFTAISMVLLLGYRTIIINTKLKRFQNESLLVALVILIIFSSTTFTWLVPNYYVGI